VKEYAELEKRSTLLQNAETIRREATTAHSSLYDADESVLDRLKVIHATLADLAKLDPSLKPTEEAMKTSVIQLEEAAFDLGHYADKLDLDPAELAEVNERLNVINRLIRKYGINVEHVLAHRANLQREIDALGGASMNVDALTAKIAPLDKQLKALAAELTKKRAAAAKKIAPQVQSQLAELGMEKAKFDVALLPLPDASPSGTDAAEFMVQTNPGLPTQPLRRIASGGEIGRIMLAIKSVLAKGEATDGSPAAMVLVFDEIDANIGGRLGSVIGAKLRQLAANHQVLCITHLPQIACYADRHLTVRKVQGGDKTQTTVLPMTGNDRVEEIAEMIGGKAITATTRAQARELLEHATAETKPKIKVTVVKPTKRIAKRL
jgi:DNA repair protein RecN (Recombination protein N)